MADPEMVVAVGKFTLMNVNMLMIARQRDPARAVLVGVIASVYSRVTVSPQVGALIVSVAMNVRVYIISTDNIRATRVRILVGVSVGAVVMNVFMVVVMVMTSAHYSGGWSITLEDMVGIGV